MISAFWRLPRVPRAFRVASRFATAAACVSAVGFWRATTVIPKSARTSVCPLNRFKTNALSARDTRSPAATAAFSAATALWKAPSATSVALAASISSCRDLISAACVNGCRRG